MSWVEKLDLSKMPDTALNSIYIEKFNDYMTCLAGADQAKTDAALALQEKFRAEIDRRTAVNPSINHGNSMQMRAMQTWFTESCPKFGPAVDVAIFIQALESGYALFVQQNKSMEHTFIQTAVSYMCGDYSTTFTKSAEFTECTQSYSRFIKYLKDNYASRETIFQILSSLWEVERRDSEDIHSLGIRFEEKAREISTRITAKYAETAEAEKLAKKTLDSEDVFLLVGSMQLFNHIRAKEPETYKLLLKDCDACLTPSDLSKKAKLYTDRLSKSDPVSHTYAARPHEPRNEAKMECLYFRRHGRCSRENCPYYHDARRLKKDTSTPSDNRTPQQDNSEKSKKKSSSRRRRNGKTNLVNSNSDNSTADNSTSDQSHDNSSSMVSSAEVFRHGV